MHFELYTKDTEKVYGSKFGHQNCIPILLCVTELIYSLAPDRAGRYTGFWYVDGKMINQLDAFKLEDNEVFHIHMELLYRNTKTFIEKSSNPSVWEVSNSEKMSAMRYFDI